MTYLILSASFVRQSCIAGRVVVNVTLEVVQLSTASLRNQP